LDLRGESEIKSGTWAWGLHSAGETQRVLGDPFSLKIGHNLNFDIPRLRKAGCDVKGPLWDTMWAAQLLQPDLDKTLNSVASTMLDVRRWKHLRPKISTMKGGKCRLRKRKDETEEEFKGRVREWETQAKKDFDVAWVEAQGDEASYNRRDAHYTLAIYEAQKEALKDTGQLSLFENSIMAALPHLISMHEVGIAVDQKVRKECVLKVGRRRDVAWKMWRDLTHGMDPNSWQQVHQQLYEEWRLPLQTKVKGKRGKGEDEKPAVTADAEALKELLKLLPNRDKRCRGIHALLTFRDLDRELAYLGMLEGGSAHPSYGPVGKDDDEAGQRYSAGAATGRLTARHPPILAWKKWLRRMFVAHDPVNNVLIEADYSQEEAWIQGWLSQDDQLLEDLASGHIHKRNAERMGIDKTRAKNLFYGSIFRGGAKAVQHQFRMKGYEVPLAEIEVLQRKLASTYWRTWVWGDNQLEKARRDRMLTNPFGRRRYFYSTEGAFNEIVNYEVQSTGADMLWELVPALAQLAQTWEQKVPRILVYDACVMEVPKKWQREAAGSLANVMQREFPQVGKGFHVPVEVKGGGNWADVSSSNPNGMKRLL
jgi:DNA polymerase I-like protein with 3'-5' exonuclease and polymerase domains